MFLIFLAYKTTETLLNNPNKLNIRGPTVAAAISEFNI